MYSITKQAEAFLEELANALEIPPTRYEQAERSYKSLGDWLHRPESSVATHGPEVFVQGSFRFGTVIRPQADGEQYDIDCACVLTRLSKADLSQSALKKLLGDEIKAYRRAKNIAKEVRPKRRCWRLEYADEAQFHMDVVPSVPNGQDQRRLLEAQYLDASFAETAIAITDEKHPNFRLNSNDWPRSNPKGYADWFTARMGEVYVRRRARVLKEMRENVATASVEDVPTYRVRTPLQSAIMILKHHRNTMFVADAENAPISIIITTLAAHAYNGEETIGNALLSILDRMDQAIDHDGKKFIIRNPTDGTENFADRWEEHPERAEAFYRWLEQARKDFASAAKLVEHRLIAGALKDRMGSNVTAMASDAVSRGSGLAKQGLVRKATAASSTVAPTVSFADAPRTPKKPDGFA